MTCLACLIAFLGSLVLGTPVSERTLQVELGSRGVALSVRPLTPERQGAALRGRIALDLERGLRVEVGI